MLRLAALLLLITSCASERTKYGKYTKDGGYLEKTIDESMRVVSFKGNSNTKVDLAKEFATFRAIEICTKENFKLTHILDVFDKTESKTVTRASTYGYPSYYYGMSPYYGGYSGLTFGLTAMDYSVYNETLRYPDVEVVYECANEVYAPGFIFREVPPDEMKHLVKDLRGGLQVERIPKEVSSPGIKGGDVIIYANGERVQETYQLLKLFHESKDHSIRVELLRDGQMKQGLLIKGLDVSDKILEGQKNIIQNVCKKEELKKNPLCLN